MKKLMLMALVGAVALGFSAGVADGAAFVRIVIPENMIQYGQLQNAFKMKGTGIWLR